MVFLYVIAMAINCNASSLFMKFRNFQWILHTGTEKEVFLISRWDVKSMSCLIIRITSLMNLMISDLRFDLLDMFHLSFFLERDLRSKQLLFAGIFVFLCEVFLP